MPVAGGLTFAAVSAGGNHTCGVTTTGVAYCWGMNPMGELGIGTSTGPEQCQKGYSVPLQQQPRRGRGWAHLRSSEHRGGPHVRGDHEWCPLLLGNHFDGVLGNDPNTGPERCESVPDP